MKEIQLTQGKVAIVDDEDFEWLNQWSWGLNSGGYARRTVAVYFKNKPRKFKTLLMHRAIMGLEIGDKRHIDHCDRAILNNTRNNLRFATQSQNRMNSSSCKNSSSRFKGVYWHKSAKKWTAQIFLNGIPQYLGIYTTEYQAAQRYNIKAKKLFGSYAHLNALCLNTI